MPTITKVEACKKNKNRVNIFLDDEFFCSLYAEIAVIHRLKAGEDIDKDFLRRLIGEDENKLALNRALEILSRKPVTEKMLLDKLREKGFSEAAALFALEKLKDYGYIDDSKYAGLYVETATDKGRLRLKKDLRNKGVSDEFIEEALPEPKNEFLRAQAVLTKYLKGNLPETLKEKNKAYRYLLAKGFGYDTAAAVMNPLVDRMK